MKTEHKDRRSTRLPYYDYTTPGAYFFTICTLNHECLFGQTMNDIVKLNSIGRIVSEEWVKTANLRPYVEIDSYIVMPNHLHGIIILRENHRRDTARRVPTTEQFSKPIAGSLPTVLRSFKSAVTKRVNILQGTPGKRLWQGRYYEHVIRNSEDLNRLREYIITNPFRWSFDRENPESQGHGAPCHYCYQLIAASLPARASPCSSSLISSSIIFCFSAV